MAGLLTHISVGLAGALIIYFAFFRSKPKEKIIYSLVFLISNIAPDLVDFGVLSIKTGSFDPGTLMRNSAFHELAVLGHTFLNWLILASIIIAIGFLFFFLKKISKKRFISIIIASILALIGVALHFKFDALIQETNYWI